MFGSEKELNIILKRNWLIILVQVGDGAKEAFRSDEEISVDGVTFKDALLISSLPSLTFFSILILFLFYTFSDHFFILKLAKASTLTTSNTYIFS